MGDLLEIANFIAQDNPVRAATFVDEIKAHCEMLAKNPGIRQSVPAIGEGVIRSVYGNYNIYYFIGDSGVVVFGVIEGHRLQALALRGRV